jgi:hypothetical protein
MRCSSCHSYIPEGLTDPAQCPQCGKSASESVPVPVPQPEPSTEYRVPSTVFAPFFTIRTKLSFGLAEAPATPTEGSISFGPEGLSIVWDEGRRWQKIAYRDLGAARLVEDSVRLSVRDVESKLLIYHGWIPGKGARRSRAETFVELLDRVQAGLTSTEISYYQRRLQ